MKSLTKKQHKVFDYVKKQLHNGVVPSQRQIAEHFGTAQNAAFQTIGYLKAKGYLTDYGGHRGIRLSQAYLESAGTSRAIPIVGRVAAGEPILAEENIEGYVDSGEIFSGSKDSFILKVHGDSMVDEGIVDGDYVIVAPCPAVADGRIAAVMVDGEATVKKVYTRRNAIVLKPANKQGGYRTKYIKRGSKDVRIIGKVTGCFRRL